MTIWANRESKAGRIRRGAWSAGGVCMSIVESVAKLFFTNPLLVLLIAAAVWSFVASLRRIGPTEVGLVTKRFSFKKLAKDNPVAFGGEAGYQADLLMPGLRWKPFFLYAVE